MLTTGPQVSKRMQDAHTAAEHDGERRPLHVILCAPAYDGWQALADSHGLTLTGLLDALGHQAQAGELDVEQALPFARSIDIKRRRSR